VTFLVGWGSVMCALESAVGFLRVDIMWRSVRWICAIRSRMIQNIALAQILLGGGG